MWLFACFFLHGTWSLNLCKCNNLWCETKRNPFIVSHCKCNEENMSRTILKRVILICLILQLPGAMAEALSLNTLQFFAAAKTHTLDWIVHVKSECSWTFSLRSGLVMLHFGCLEKFSSLNPNMYKNCLWIQKLCEMLQKLNKSLFLYCDKLDKFNIHSRKSDIMGAIWPLEDCN